MSNSWWENISFWCAVEMEAKPKLTYKTQQLLVTCWNLSGNTSGHPLVCRLWVMAENYSLISGYLTKSYLTSGTTAGRLVAQKNAPLAFKTFFPSLLCYLRHPAMSLITTIKDIPSTPASSILYCRWWMVAVVSNLFGLLFSWSKTVGSCQPCSLAFCDLMIWDGETLLENSCRS